MSKKPLWGLILGFILLLTACHWPSARSGAWKESKYSGKTWNSIGQIWKLDQDGKLGFRETLAPIILESNILTEKKEAHIKAFLGQPNAEEIDSCSYFAGNSSLVIHYSPRKTGRYVNYSPQKEQNQVYSYLLNLEQEIELWNSLSAIWLAPECDPVLKSALIQPLESYSIWGDRMEITISFVDQMLGVPKSKKAFRDGTAYYFDLTDPKEENISSKHAFFWFDDSGNLKEIKAVVKIEAGEGAYNWNAE